MGIFDDLVMNKFRVYLRSMQDKMLELVPQDFSPAEIMALYVNPDDRAPLMRAHELTGRMGQCETVLANYEGRTVTATVGLRWTVEDAFLFPKYMRGRGVLDTAPKETRKKLEAWVEASMDVAAQFKYWMLALDALDARSSSIEEIFFFMPTLAFLMQLTTEGNGILAVTALPAEDFKTKLDWNRYLRQKGIVARKLQPKRIPRMDGWIIDASTEADTMLTQWRMVADTSVPSKPITLTLSANDTKVASPAFEDKLVAMLS